MGVLCGQKVIVVTGASQSSPDFQSMSKAAERLLQLINELARMQAVFVATRMQRFAGPLDQFGSWGRRDSVWIAVRGPAHTHQCPFQLASAGKSNRMLTESGCMLRDKLPYPVHSSSENS